MSEKTKLQLSANIVGQDDFYAELLGAHDGLDDAQSQALNSSLVLLLANHIGDRAVLRQAMAQARRAVLDEDHHST